MHAQTAMHGTQNAASSNMRPNEQCKNWNFSHRKQLTILHRRFINYSLALIAER